MTQTEAAREARQKLKEFKQIQERKGICCDYDETLISSKKAPTISVKDVITLMIRVAEAEIVPLIATARGVTMEKIFTEGFKDVERKRNDAGLVVYIAGADGRSLVKYSDGKKVETVYEYALSHGQIQSATDAFLSVQSVIGKQDSASVSVFQKFVSDTWDASLLPKKYLVAARKFDGGVFIEPTKFTLVGSEDPGRYDVVLSALNEKLKGVDLHASWGGRDRFIHIRPAFKEDGKLMALRTVAKEEGIPFNHFVTFGDAPLGNDQGILTAVPYAFTNATDYFVHHHKDIPPYLLTHKNSPIHAVHSAIKYICDLSNERL